MGHAEDRVTWMFEYIIYKLSKLEAKMVASQTDLDAVVAQIKDSDSTLAGAISAIQAAVSMILDKLKAAGSPVDLSAEVTTLQQVNTDLGAASNNLKQATDAINLAVTPPAPTPTPAPTPNPAPSTPS